MILYFFRAPNGCLSSSRQRVHLSPSAGRLLVESGLVEGIKCSHEYRRAFDPLE
jgi:hypothetical protein